MLKKVWQSRTCFNFIRTLLAVGIALGLTMVIICLLYTSRCV